MKILRLLFLLVLLPAPTLVHAQSYPYFAPGGSLSCTAPCRNNQIVNLAAGSSFITGTLPQANLLTCAANQIVYDNASAQLTCSSNLTYDGMTLTITAAGTPTAPGLLLSGNTPIMVFSNTAASTDRKRYVENVDSSGTYSLFSSNDVGTVFRNVMQVTKATVAVNSISWGNVTDNPSFNFLGTGAGTTSGSWTFGGIRATGTIASPVGGTSAIWAGNNGGTLAQLSWSTSTAPANSRVWDSIVDGTGLFRISASDDTDANGRNLLAASRSGTAIQAIQFGNGTDSPPLQMIGQLQSAGTAPTLVGASACATPGAVHSTSFAGEFQTSGSGTCTFTLTFSKSATNGYVCAGSNLTAISIAVQTNRATNSCVMTVPTTGASQVVTWMAIGY